MRQYMPPPTAPNKITKIAMMIRRDFVLDLEPIVANFRRNSPFRILQFVESYFTVWMDTFLLFSQW